MLRQMWFEFCLQAKMVFPEMNPKHILIYQGNVYRIRHHELQILSPKSYQHFQELRNTAWFTTVPSLEHKIMMDSWTKRGVVAQQLPFVKDFERLTWRLN